MAERYRPFRDIRTPEDLLLARREIKRAPVNVRMPAGYYPEICAWVTIRCDEADLFAEEGQTLLESVIEDGDGWRLSLTPHGYLRFESTGGPDFECESGLPVHAAVDAKKSFRLGLALTNYAWSMRDTPYAHEAAGSFRLHLLAGPATGEPMSRIGESSAMPSPDLSPVPERLVVGANADGSGRFAGRITGVTAYNTARERLVTAPPARSAARLLPAVPGGGGFAARWRDDETVEVFTRPTFSLSSSYWVFLKLPADAPEMRRLRVDLKWAGGVNMSPTFFFSPDRKRWQQVVPARMHMADERTDFRVEFELTQAMKRGGYLASGPVFGEPEYADLLAWAEGQQHTSVREIGKSVEGRPIHLIRVGSGEDGPDRRGVAITCGQHSPLEIMGGHVIRPMIERVLKIPALLASTNFYFVPTMNVDCAHHGGNGMNVNRSNLNRQWLVDLEPETAAVIECFDGLKDRGQSVDLAVDIHAGGIFRNHILMHMGDGEGCTLTRGAKAEQEVWRDLLERHAGLRRSDGWALAQMRFRANDYFHQVHGTTAFCLEMSSCSWFDPSDGRTKAFSTDTFAAVGEGIARVCEERFR